MPYPIATDPQVVRDLQRKLWTSLDQHLLWAFNPQRELSRHASADR